MAGPLEGIRVADFTWVWAGPTCTMQLAHMGAEVIRMESMRRVCTLRMLPPWPDGQPGVNRSGYFNQYNQGKRSIQLDISKPDGVDCVRPIASAPPLVAAPTWTVTRPSTSPIRRRASGRASEISWRISRW